MAPNPEGSKWSKIQASFRARKVGESKMQKFRSEPARTEPPGISPAPSPKSLSSSKRYLLGSKRRLKTQNSQELKSESLNNDANVVTNITTSPLSMHSKAESPETGNASGNSVMGIDQDPNVDIQPTTEPALNAQEHPTRSSGRDTLQRVVSSLHKTVQINNPIPRIQQLIDSDSSANEQSESAVYKSSTFVVGRFDDLQNSEQVSDGETKEASLHEGPESALPSPACRSIRIEKGRL